MNMAIRQVKEKKKKTNKLLWTKTLLMLIPQNICLKRVRHRALDSSHFDPPDLVR